MTIKNRKLKIFLSSFIALFYTCTAVWAQELPVEPHQKEKMDMIITDRMIDQFATVTDELNTIQKDAQLEMIDAIDFQGLTVEEFNQMVNMDKYPKGEETKAVSRKDKIAFDNAKKQVDQIRSEMEQRMDDAIMNAGLNLDEYQAVRRAYNEDPGMRKRIEQKVGSKP